jgi:hypothetical protein
MVVASEVGLFSLKVQIIGSPSLGTSGSTAMFTRPEPVIVVRQKLLRSTIASPTMMILISIFHASDFFRIMIIPHPMILFAFTFTFEFPLSAVAFHRSSLGLPCVVSVIKLFGFCLFVTQMGNHHLFPFMRNSPLAVQTIIQKCKRKLPLNEIARRSNTIENINRIVALCHEEHIPVIWVRHSKR